MNYKIISILAFGILLSIIIKNNSGVDGNTNIVVKTNNQSKEKKVPKIINKRSELKFDTTSLPENLKIIVEELKPINSEILRSEWKTEFGCYKLDENCDSIFLTASSYEEALWMQRQGYPSKSNMQLLNGDVLALKKLANVYKYSPAMALLTIRQLNDGNYNEASSMALKLDSYTSKYDTFPHRLYGEALLADNNLQYGLLELKIASLLGDLESQYLFNRYTHEHPDIAIDATNHANLYMGRVFGVPYGQYPSDPRPNNNGG